MTASEIDVNGTTITPTLSTFGPDSVMMRGPNIISSIYNAECTPATYIAFYTSAKFKTVFIPYVLPAVNSFTLNGEFCLVVCSHHTCRHLQPKHTPTTATYADLADLMYPTIANKQGQWVPNQECLQKCGLKMPAAVQAAG